MRLGAQRGYDEVIETFDGTVGVVGRVMRTGDPQFVPDVTVDPEYRAASPDAPDAKGVRNGEDPAPVPPKKRSRVKRPRAG